MMITAAAHDIMAVVSTNARLACLLSVTQAHKCARDGALQCSGAEVAAAAAAAAGVTAAARRRRHRNRQRPLLLTRRHMNQRVHTHCAQVIAGMLQKLGDKYTRYLPPAKYQTIVQARPRTYYC
jgi:hypothetical protein